jgi:hypothetical protein
LPSINCTAGRLNQAREESLVFATSGANTNSGLEAQPTSAEAETLLNNNNIPQFNATQTTNYGLTNQRADEVSPARDSGSPHDQISPLFTPSSFVGTNADAERGPEASLRLPSDEMSVQNAIEHSFPSHEDTATQTGSSGETGRGVDYVPFQGSTTNFDDSTTEVDNSSSVVTSDCPDAADSHKQRGFLPPIKQLLHIADNQGQEPPNLLFSGLRVENVFENEMLGIPTENSRAPRPPRSVAVVPTAAPVLNSTESLEAVRAISPGEVSLFLADMCTATQEGEFIWDMSDPRLYDDELPINFFDTT